MTVKELRDLLEKEFEIIGNCVTERSLEQFRQGMFWDNLKEFISDKDVILSPNQMVENYLEDTLEAVGDYDGDLTKDAVNEIFLQLWADDDVYVDIESIVNLFSYNEEL